MSDKYLPKNFNSLSVEEKVRMIAGSLSRRGDSYLDALTCGSFARWNMREVRREIQDLCRGYVQFRFLFEPARTTLAELDTLKPRA